MHAIKSYGGENFQPYSFLISLLEGVIYPLHAPAVLPSGKQLLQLLNGRLYGPQRRSEHFGLQRIPLPLPAILCQSQCVGVYVYTPEYLIPLPVTAIILRPFKVIHNADYFISLQFYLSHYFAFHYIWGKFHHTFVNDVHTLKLVICTQTNKIT